MEEEKHATLMTDDEVIGEYKFLHSEARGFRVIGMKMHISKENKLHDLIEEINHRGLDVELGSAE